MPARRTGRTGRTRTFPRPTRRASSRSTRARENFSAKTTLTSARAFSTANGVRLRSRRSTTKTGDITKTGKIWSYDKIHRSISTVSIDPNSGLLFIGDFSGFLHCLDAETGKVCWTHDMKAHLWGSTLVADGKVYAGDEDGDFIVMTASKEKKILSETN